MNTMRRNTWLRPGKMDAGMKITILLVIVLIVSWWIFLTRHRQVAMVDLNQPTVETVSDIPEKIVLENEMVILFPKSVRCDNREVNQFVSDFLNVLAGKKYKEYRLMVTQQREPVGREMFEKAYDRMGKIEVTGIDKIEDMRLLSQVKLEMTPPVYCLKAHVVLRDNSTRDVELQIFKENGTWVSSN
jgi:hypothetical protein